MNPVLILGGMLAAWLFNQKSPVKDILPTDGTLPATLPVPGMVKRKRKKKK